MAAPGPIQRMLSLFSNFHTGFRLTDNDALRNMANALFAPRSNLLAFAGGGFANATLLEGTTMTRYYRASTVATAGDSFMLPYPIAGRTIEFWNDGAASAQLFSPNGQTPGGAIQASTIVPLGARTGAGVAGTAGVAVASGTIMRLVCFDTDTWKVTDQG